MCAVCWCEKVHFVCAYSQISVPLLQLNWCVCDALIRTIPMISVCVCVCVCVSAHVCVHMCACMMCVDGKIK